MSFNFCEEKATDKTQLGMIDNDRGCIAMTLELLIFFIIPSLSIILGVFCNLGLDGISDTRK
jgi:hypothetical protein